jgi:hypothetical protein
MDFLKHKPYSNFRSTLKVSIKKKKKFKITIKHTINQIIILKISSIFNKNLTYS